MVRSNLILSPVFQGEVILERIDIFIERIATSVGRTAGGARLLAFEALLHGNVAGLAELVYLHAEVAGRGARLLSDIDEVRLLDPDEDRHHGEAEFGMQQRIQFSEHSLSLYEFGDDATDGHNDAAEKPYQADLRTLVVCVEGTGQNHKRTGSDNRPTLDDDACGQYCEPEQRGDEVGVKHKGVDRASEDCQANGSDTESAPNPAYSLMEICFRSVASSF